MRKRLTVLFAVIVILDAVAVAQSTRATCVGWKPRALIPESLFFPPV
jgi:hypothetical protein